MKKEKLMPMFQTVRDITNTYDMLDGPGYAMYQNDIRASVGDLLDMYEW